MNIFSISDIEEGINKCSREIPMPEGELSEPGILLAEIYGLMIYEKRTEIDIDAIVENPFYEGIAKNVEAVKRYCSSPK